MSRRGFTLMEVLVAGALMSLVTLAIVLIFSQSRSAYEWGSSRMSMDQKARESVRKMAPYLRSAFSIQPGGGGAVYLPATTGASGDNVTFSTTEDWLGAGYPGRGTSATIYDPGLSRLTFSEYRVRFAPSAQGPPGSGDIVLEKVAGSGPYSAVSQRTLVRSTADAAIVQALFSRLYDNSSVIQVDVTTWAATRNAQLQQRELYGTVRSTINIAAESLRG